jgi:ADP-ribose pyrophosphatase
MSEPSTRAPLADGPAEAEASAPEIVGKGFHPLARFRVKLQHPDGTNTSLTRDLLCVGPVVGVLAIDPVRDVLVLIRQFRLGAHRALGLGEVVEIVAGHVESGESYEQAAHRECLEEIGIAPGSLHPLFTFMPAPGSNDEHAKMFLAIVDAAQVPERGGAAHESEDTRPFCVDVDTALAALREDRVHNGYLILALQWLALNRHRVGAMAAGAGEPR